LGFSHSRNFPFPQLDAEQAGYAPLDSCKIRCKLFANRSLNLN
jgi:hypothetical protein